MNVLKAGFSRVDITPPLGTNLAGHPHPESRLGAEVLDPLEINTLAVEANGKIAVLISADLLYLRRKFSDQIRKMVAQENNIPYESIFIACTHTHTAPLISTDNIDDFPINEVTRAYRLALPEKFVEATRLAIADLKPAQMGYAVSTAKNISYIRRFRMKNGYVHTNPGLGNPNVVEPIGQIDDRVNVLRIVREGGKEIAVANFGVHPDTLNLPVISADYPHTVRATLEAAMPVHAIFFTGAQGDINHQKVIGKPISQTDFVRENDLIDKKYKVTEYINPNHMGRAIAGAVLQVYGDVEWVDVDTIAYGNQECVVPTNQPEPEEIPWAHHIIQLQRENREDEIEYDPEKGKRAHVIAKAARILRMENAPLEESLPMSAVRIGPVAFVGIPGEPFNGIGLGLKEGSPFEFTLPCCLTNGAQGYYPMYECYAEGGYEAVSSNYKAGVAERLIETGVELMNKLK